MATIRCGERSFSDIKAVLFDKDGTLADSTAYLRGVGQKRARVIDAQIPGVKDPLLLAFGFDDEQQLNPAGLLAIGSRQETAIVAAGYVAETGRGWQEARELVNAAFSEADATWSKNKAEATPLFEEARAFLQDLKQAGVAIAIISADITANIEKFVDYYDLGTLVQLTRGADQSPAKPDPEAYRQVCVNLGVDPAETLMLGDAPTDLSMARGAGAAGAIGVSWGWPVMVDIAGADMMLHQWSQLTVALADSPSA